MLGGDAGKDHLLLHGGFQFLIGKRIKVKAGNDARVISLHNANAAGDRFCGEAIITCDHDDADAGMMTFFHRLCDFPSRGVHHGNQTQ